MWNPFAAANPNPTTQQAPANPANSGNPAPQPGQQTPANPDPFAKPAAPNPEPQNKAPVSPLDQFNDLMQTSKDNGEKPNNGPAPIFEYDPAKLREAVGTMQFADQQQVGELITKALKDGDATALMQAMNTFAQNSYYQGMLMNAKMVEEGTKISSQRLQEHLPNQVRNASATHSLHSTNAAFQHPAIKPWVDNMTAAFAQKNPNWTPAQVAEAVTNYMSTVASVFSGAPGGNPTNSSPTIQSQGNADFSNYFNPNNR